MSNQEIKNLWTRSLLSLWILFSFSTLVGLGCSFQKKIFHSRLIQTSDSAQVSASPTPSPSPSTDRDKGLIPNQEGESLPTPSPTTTLTPTPTPAPPAAPQATPSSTPLLPSPPPSLAPLPARIFNEDPLRDSKNPSLDPYLELNSYTSLTNINGLSPGGGFENRYLKISEDTAFPNQIAVASSGLSYNTSDPRFAQVNAFYHANNLMQRVSSIGFPPERFSKISIDAHCDFLNNAFYSYYSRRVCLGYTGAVQSRGKLWTSFDADVITHEFGHSLNHTFSSSDILSNLEMGAVDEATADFWANTTFHRPDLGSWFILGYELNRNPAFVTQEFLNLRDSNRIPKYPRDIVGEVHDDGIFWASTLWSSRLPRFTWQS